MGKNEVLFPLGSRTAPENTYKTWRTKRFLGHISRLGEISRSSHAVFSFLAVACLVLCGCGGINITSSNTILATPGSIAFGSVAIGQSASAQIVLTNHTLGAVEITALNTSAQSFSVVNEGVLPATIPSGGSYFVTVSFAPSAAGPASGQLIVNSSNPATPTTTIGLNGTGLPGLLSLTCNLTSFTGSGTDACSIKLNAPAASGGLPLTLSSSSSAVTVPATVTVPANTTSVGFGASVSTVGSAQSVTITVSGVGGSASFALQLSPNAPTLTFNASGLAFGSTALNVPITQEVMVTSSGTLPVSITSVSVAGKNFTLPGATFPLTLLPGQTVSLSVEFNPTTLGVSTGQLSITSNSIGNSTSVISLSGTGVAYEVELTWNAPSSATAAILGYHIYRATGGSSTYQLMSTSTDPETTYIDTTVQSGNVYDYVVQTVGSSGAESGPSNTASVTVP